MTYHVEVDGAGLSYAEAVFELAARGVTIRSVEPPEGDYWRLSASVETEADMAAAESTLVSYFGARLVCCVDRALAVHRFGMVNVTPSVRVDTADEVALVYGAGAERAARHISSEPAAVDQLTGRANSVAIVSDGSGLRGLGDVGPAGALPVMEGKAVLFDVLAGVNAIPLCVNAPTTDDFVSTVVAVSPSFGGINLDGIAAPKCVEIERRLRERLEVPVFHDDQHGTAVVACAALFNALEVTGRRLDEARVVVYGTGPGATAVTRSLVAAGAGDIVVWSSVGVLRPEVGHLVEPHERWLAHHTNPRGLSGELGSVLRGADVLIVSAMRARWAGTVTAVMAPQPIVLALPGAGLVARDRTAGNGAVVSLTGIGDTNQINGLLAFPGAFRGLLDARARSVTGEVVLAAARALAEVARPSLAPTRLLPDVLDPLVVPAVVEAVRTAVLARGDGPDGAVGAP